MSKNEVLRFHVIHNIPSPYRLFLFHKLAIELERRGVEFHVHFMSTGHRDRPHWESLSSDICFNHTFWADSGPMFRGRKVHLNLGLIFFLQKTCVDFLLIGGPWDSLTGALSSFLACRMQGIAWYESNTKTPGRVRGPAGFFKRQLLRRFRFVAVPGEEGKRHLQLLWGSRNPVPPSVRLPNLVDESVFVPGSNTSMKRSRAEIRSHLDIDPHCRLAIWPARLNRNKGILEFMANLTPDMLNNGRILLIGEGEVEPEIRNLIVDRSLESVVQMRSYVAYSDMPRYYQCSDLFILASLRDPCPLSVVEAAHCGLPLLLSNRLGNFSEALDGGANGWGFDPLDAESVNGAVREAFGVSSDELKLMGARSREIAEKTWNSSRCVSEFLDSLGVNMGSERE